MPHRLWVPAIFYLSQSGSISHDPLKALPTLGFSVNMSKIEHSSGFQSNIQILFVIKNIIQKVSTINAQPPLLF